MPSSRGFAALSYERVHKARQVIPSGQMLPYIMDGAGLIVTRALDRCPSDAVGSLLKGERTRVTKLQRNPRERNSRAPRRLPSRPSI